MFVRVDFNLIGVQNSGQGLPRGKNPQRGNRKLHQRIAPADPGAAGAAAASEGDPTEERDVLPPGERAVAVAAVRAGADDALARGPAAQADVEKAAEGEAEQAGKDRSQDTNHVEVEYIAAHPRKVD